MNRISPILLVLTLIAFSITDAASFNENTTIETSDLGAQIIDTLGHNLIETKDNWGDILAVFYIVVILLSFAILLIFALITIK